MNNRFGSIKMDGDPVARRSYKRKAASEGTPREIREKLLIATLKLDTTGAQLAMTEYKLGTTEGELRTTKDKLKATEDKLATTDGRLKTIDDRLKATDDKLKTTSDKLKTAEDALEGAKAALMCRICLNTPMETAILPCAHGGFCGTCCARFTRCPVCRGGIVSRIRVYL